MQPDSPSVSALIRRVAGKEIGLFFASPVASLVALWGMSGVRALEQVAQQLEQRDGVRKVGL